jgi:hypothetical protein
MNKNIFETIATNSKWNPLLKTKLKSNAIDVLNKIELAKKFNKNPIGLLIGKIQSGKTANIISIISNAIENDYRLIIVFLADQNTLYSQNFSRLVEAFKGTEEKIKILDNSKNSNQIKEYSSDPEDVDFSFSKGKTFIVSTLKHHKRLKDLTKTFINSQYSSSKVLIIDDEGDDISPNTHKNKYESNNNFSTTNSSIVELMKGFNEYCYLSVTATPQANILFKKYEVLSPNFIKLVYPGLGYTGLEYFHNGDNLNLVETIDDFDDISQDKRIPKSIYKALGFYLLGAHLRILKESEKHGFLIHVDKYLANQETIHIKIKLLVETLKSIRDINSSFFLTFYENIKIILETNKTLINKDLSDETKKKNFGLSLLLKLKETKVILLNGNQDVTDLLQKIDDRQYFIVIGADMLDRGLTIPGLSVSYYTRDTKKAQVDTLLQRARWFGYKEDYIDFCKLYTTNKNLQKFESILEHEQQLWDYLETVKDYKGDFRDLEYKFKMDSEILSPTSKNKAQWVQGIMEKWRTQNYFSPSKKDQVFNLELISKFFKTHRFETKSYNSNFLNLSGLISFNNVQNLIQLFKFSELDTNPLNKYINELSNQYPQIKNEQIEVVYLKYEIGQETKVKDVNNFKLSNIMQGRNKDSAKYLGDREIISDKPMLQVHRIILKDELNSDLKIGDSVIALAFGLPKHILSESIIMSNKT